METQFLPGLDMGLNFIVGLMVKILFGLVTIASLIMVRQTSLMDRVVNVPVGNWFKGVAWGFLFVSLVLTLGVILIV